MATHSGIILPGQACNNHPVALSENVVSNEEVTRCYSGGYDLTLLSSWDVARRGLFDQVNLKPPQGQDPDGHLLELITRPYDLGESG